MWIILLLVVAFVIWHFIPQPDPNRPSPRFRQDARAVETDPNWMAFIEEHCESPAETAFLHAMVKAFDLKPSDGSLAGAGLRLDFQVEEGCYRVDFLIDRWLVVEIDGAAWHSSAEAIARDKARDDDLGRLGYSVLRIPATVVFKTPEDAMQRVRSALREGKRTLPTPVQKTGWQRLSETVSAFGDGIAAANDFARRAQAVQLATEDAKLAAHNERNAISAAISMAQTELETADWLEGADGRTRELFEESYVSVMAAVADRRSARQEDVDHKIEVRAFPAAPPPHENPAYNVAIQAAYSRIAQERTDFLVSQRRLLDSDHRMRSIVEKKLGKLRCGEYWRLLHSA